MIFYSPTVLFIRLFYSRLLIKQKEVPGIKNLDQPTIKPEFLSSFFNHDIKGRKNRFFITAESSLLYMFSPASSSRTAKKAERFCQLKKGVHFRAVCSKIRKEQKRRKISWLTRKSIDFGNIKKRNTILWRPLALPFFFVSGSLWD